MEFQSARRHAHQDAKSYLGKLRGGNARHVDPLRDVDEPAKATVERTRDEVSDAFFKLHPEHLEYRDEIVSRHFQAPRYSFVADVWDEVTVNCFNGNGTT
jgi:hypothetical protein